MLKTLSSVHKESAIGLSANRIHLLLIDDAKCGLADIAAGRTQDADTALAEIQKRRKLASKKSSTLK